MWCVHHRAREGSRRVLWQSSSRKIDGGVFRRLWPKLQETRRDHTVTVDAGVRVSEDIACGIESNSRLSGWLAAVDRSITKFWSE